MIFFNSRKKKFQIPFLKKQNLNLNLTNYIISIKLNYFRFFMEENTQKSIFMSEQLKYNADKYKGIKEEFKKAEVILKLNTSFYFLNHLPI